MSGDATPPIDRPDEPHFSVVAIPDTQVYTKSEAHLDLFEAQARWIVDGVDEENIAFVVHEGDLVDAPEEDQLGRADDVLAILDDAGVPYLVAIGNHDYDDVALRDASSFETHVPESRFSDRPWWGDSFDGTAYNAYARFEALGERYIVFALELFPREDVIEWASEVLDRHDDHSAIAVTHGYLYSNATPIGAADNWDRTSYDMDGHNGDELWDAFVGQEAALRLVCSGHVLIDGGARLTTSGADGTPVHQLLTNFQSREDGGRGYLRIIRFFPAADVMTVETFSPVLGGYHPDEDLHFRIDDASAGDGDRTYGEFISYR